MTTSTRTRPWTLGAATAILASALLLAGCSNAPESGIPEGNTPSGSRKPTAQPTPGAQAYAECMREYDIDMSDPDPATGLPTLGDSVDPDGPAFIAAQEACGDLLPGGIRGEEDTTDTETYLAFAECMRENGVPDFPDPQPGSGEGLFPGIDRTDPAFQQALEACGDLSGAGQ